MDFLFIVVALYLMYVIFYHSRVRSKSTERPKTYLEKNKPNYDDVYPYISSSSLLTKAELNFFKVLTLTLLDTDYYICPMVRLADVLQVYNSNNYQSHFNRIRSKHIDFLLCDKYTFKPLIAIELDDSSHNFDNRIERDDFLNAAFYSAGLKLVRFKAYHSYTVTEIKERLNLRVPNN